MTLPIANITKTGVYDSGNNRAFTGDYLLMAENVGVGIWKYFGSGWPFINIIKGAQDNDNNRGGSFVHVGNGFYDTSGTGDWSPIVTGSGTGPDRYFPAGTWVLRWVGSCGGDWDATSQTWCTETGSQTDSLIAGQTQGDYDGVGANGSFSAGTGHAVDDVITFVSGATATIDAVSGGAVTQFTVDKAGDYSSGTGGPATGDDGTQAAASADNQASSTGSGTGFNLTPGVNNIIHRRTYATTPANLSATGFGSNTEFTNGTCTRAELLQPGNEARFSQGNIMATEWLNDMTGVRVLRFMGAQATNNSKFRNYADLPDFDDAVWGPGWSTSHRCGNAWPIKACCKAVNELATHSSLSVGFWICVPHQFLDTISGSTTALESLAQECDTELDSGNDLYVEYSNETWNSATAFKDQFRWTSQGEVSAKEGAITKSTSNVNIINHGYSTGDFIAFYYMEEHEKSMFPYNEGGFLYVIRDDSDNFRLAPSNAAALADEDVTDTGGSDYNSSWDTSLPANATKFQSLSNVRVKSGTSVKSQNTNHAEMSEKVWEVFDSEVLSRSVYAMMAGQRTNTGVVDTRMQVAAARDRADYWGPAAYYRFLERITNGARDSWGRMTYLVNGQDETNYDSTNKVVNGEDETKYDPTNLSAGAEGFDGGSGHSASDVITLDDNITATVDAVSAGVVTEFTIDSTSDSGAPHSYNETLSQVSSTGSGTGFAITLGNYNIAWNGTFAGGTGYSVSDVITLSPVFTVSGNDFLGIEDYVGDWTDAYQFATTGTLPAPLQTGTDYYVVNTDRSGGTVQFSTTPDGERLVLTDTGTGTHYFANAPTVTVDAVSSGVVTQFTVNASSDYGHHEPGTAIPQAVTTGSGTGFSLTPEAANINTDPTVTTADAENYLKDINWLRIQNDIQEGEQLVGRVGGMLYEGYDANGGKSWTYKIRSIGEFIISWWASSERQSFTTWFTRKLSDIEVRINAHHSDYGAGSETGAFGRLAHQGDDDAPSTLGLQTFYDNDGQAGKS